MLNDNLYDLMLDNDETWIIFSDGNAMLVNDCQLLDC